MAAAITAASLAGGAGGLIGSALASVVGAHHANHIQEQLEHGGLLLWVFLRDDEDEKRAKEILVKHSAHDVHVHTYSVPIG